MVKLENEKKNEKLTPNSLLVEAIGLIKKNV